MRSQVQLRTFIALLAITGIGFAVYKHFFVGYPLLPKQQIPIWTIEAKITFRATGGPVKLTFAVPGEQQDFGVLDEVGTSQGYGFTPANTAEQDTSLFRSVVWSREDAKGPQELYYRIDVYQKPSRERMDRTPPPLTLDPIYEEGPLAVAADAIIDRARRRSSDAETFCSQLLMLIADPNDQNAQSLLDEANNDLKKIRVVQNLTIKAGYQAHLLRVLVLGESANYQSLLPMLLVGGEERPYHLFQWDRPQPIEGDDLLAWQRGGPSLVELHGGRGAKVEFAMVRHQLPAEFVLEEAADQQKRTVVGVSLSSLSIEQQNSYRMLLMIPFGALVVVIMRNLVGVKTSGTFMPILLAMAFLKTTLLSGLFLFAIVVSVGLMMRSYLSKLDLLLVPRISAVVVVVIGIMVAFGILGAKFDLAIAQSVTLFPTIILAWTVERLSVLWEEDGAREVAVQTAGSLFVAILAYAVMGNSVLRYQVFVFPELLLVVLAVILALGQYAGYRVSELIRFAPLANQKENADQ